MMSMKRTEVKSLYKAVSVAVLHRRCTASTTADFLLLLIASEDMQLRVNIVSLTSALCSIISEYVRQRKIIL